MKERTIQRKKIGERYKLQVQCTAVELIQKAQASKAQKMCFLCLKIATIACGPAVWIGEEKSESESSKVGRANGSLCFTNSR